MQRISGAGNSLESGSIRPERLGDGLAHLCVHGFEAHRALDETVDADLVVEDPARALTGRDAREDQHRLAGVPLRRFKELPSLFVGQVELELHAVSVLRIIEHFQQTPRPDETATREDYMLPGKTKS